MKAILSNLGFVMQISGISITIPIVISFLYNETSATIALLVTAIVFFAFGFILNALCERKELTFKQSSSLIVLAFIFLSVIGAIPYLYVGISHGDIFQKITDSIFESASGFTTTGFSVISNLSVLPQSILFYRALTQFIGGIGIVLILLAFFYPDEKLQEFSRSMSLNENHKIKRTFILILFIYLIYSVVMVGAGFLFGYKDIVNLISFVFSALSTGGFAPVNGITALATHAPLNYILIISMVLGASNFIVLAGLFKLKIKEFLRSEVTIFIILSAISIAVIRGVFQLSLFDSIFHSISAMSTTGFGYLPIQNFTNNLKLFLIVLMFIGGASLSTAGGIKIYRFILIFKAAKKVIVDSIRKEDNKIHLFGRDYTNMEVIQSLSVVILMAGIVFAASVVLNTYNFDPIDSVFEATSAIATTGLSVGIVGPSLAIELKWLFIFLMLLGRVEVLAFLIMLSRTREQSNNHQAEADL